jgi:serine/threonine protein kinase
MYAVGCVIYELIMKKTPYIISNIFNAKEIVSKGNFGKIPKKKEGGIYSDEIVDLTHLLIHSVIIYYLLFIIYYKLLPYSIFILFSIFINLLCIIMYYFI